MRLGPKEKEILRCLKPGEWVPPSVYLSGWYNCPSQAPYVKSRQRLVDKGLAVFRYQVMTPGEWREKEQMGFRPGRETAEYNGAMKLTKTGEKVFQQLQGV